MPILVIANNERAEKTGKLELIASHGFDLASGRFVVLPCEHPSSLGAFFSPEYGEWVIPDRKNPVQTEPR